MNAAVAGSVPIASQALKHIAVIYAVQKDICGRSAEERYLVRQQKSRPLIETFEAWLRAKLALISEKIKLAEAIRYALSRCLPDQMVGVEHWAVIASLIETCKNDANPLAYLTDVITRIVSGHPDRHVNQLLPWAYRAEALKAVA